MNFFYPNINKKLIWWLRWDIKNIILRNNMMIKFSLIPYPLQPRVTFAALFFFRALKMSYNSWVNMVHYGFRSVWIKRFVNFGTGHK